LAENVKEGVYSLPMVALLETADRVTPAVIEEIEEILTDDSAKNFVKIVFRRVGGNELFTEFINFQNPIKLRLAKDSRNKRI